MSLQNAIGHNGNGNGSNGGCWNQQHGVIITSSATPLPEGVHLPLYMDNHATTQLDPRVLEAMMPYSPAVRQRGQPQPPVGWEAEKAVETAREQIAKLIGATAKEIIFTSGATESDNLALKGVAEMYRERGRHIITQVTEHKAILDTCKKLEKQGLPRDVSAGDGGRLIDLDDLKRAIVTEGPEKTILVSIMFANNEIGVIQPIARSAGSATRGRTLPHRRSAGVGKVPGGCAGDEHRPVEHLCAQAVRAEGRGGAVRSAAQPAGAAHRADQRRRARARNAQRTLNVPGIVWTGARRARSA